MWHLWLHVGGTKREYTPVSTMAETTESGSIRLLIKLSQ